MVFSKREYLPLRVSPCSSLGLNAIDGFGVRKSSVPPSHFTLTLHPHTPPSHFALTQRLNVTKSRAQVKTTVMPAAGENIRYIGTTFSDPRTCNDHNTTASKQGP